MLEVVVYAELCSRLSKCVQLRPCDKELREIMNELIALYDRVDLSEQCDSDIPRVGFAAIDELVLLSVHKLLNTFVCGASFVLQELMFTAFNRVLLRCKSRMQSNSLGHVQRRLSFVQSCALYLPQPPQAGGEQQVEMTTLASQPEELRVSILKSLRQLFDEKDPPDQPMELQEDQQHFFAYLVASLLHIAHRDRCREASLEAIEVLKLVLLFIRDPKMLRQVLPGCAADLWKSANAPQQASKVIVAALNCFALLLDLCIGDDKISGDEEMKQKQPKFSLDAIRQFAETKENPTRTGEMADLPSTENDKWLQTASINVDLLLSRMFAASITANGGTTFGLPRLSWRVRCALAQLCGTVMLRCRQALRMSFFRCHDELLILRGDSIAAVANQADTVLQKLQMSALSPEERLRVLPEMADRFQMLLSTLVLKLSAEHEATKVHYVRTLRGYLSFLGTGLTPYFDASMETIYISLCRVASFAALDIELVVHQKLPRAPEADKISDSLAASTIVSEFQKRLRFFHEKSSIDEVLLMLRDVGVVSTPAGFIDCAFTLLSDTQNSCLTEFGGAEVVLVLNEFLRGYCLNKKCDNESLDVHLIGRILEDLLALKAWEAHTSPPTHRSSKACVSQRALMVECISVCAEILGAKFKLFLLHVLYPLVEQLGSQDVEVERAALAALEKVYFYTGYQSLEALFQANMDYFVDALCARLEQLAVYPMTAFVIEALLKHSRLASLPLVDEVASSLLHSVDLYQDSPLVNGLLRALKSLLGSIVRDAQEAGGNEGGNCVVRKVTPDSLLDNFIHEMKSLANDGIDALDIDTQTDKEAKDFSETTLDLQSVKGAMPIEYDEIQESNQEQEGGYRALVLEIMDRCGYFLVESDPIACCLVLSLIDEGVQFFSQHQKQLLPLVARIWPELLPRLHVKNRAILIGTIRVITTLTQIAGDFVGDRFVETVWPVLQSQLQFINFGEDAKSLHLTRSMLLLTPHNEVASGIDVRPPDADPDAQLLKESELSAVSGTRRTQEICQLLATLSCLTTVCKQSETVTQLVPAIASACSKYLSHEAPREVVEKTSELFEALNQLNGDEVFCTVAALADWLPMAPPCERFPRLERTNEVLSGKCMYLDEALIQLISSSFGYSSLKS